MVAVAPAPKASRGKAKKAAEKTAACCTAPASSTCAAYMQTLSVKLLSSSSEWAAQYFCALDASGHTRLTPAEDAFSNCLSLSSTDTLHECETDAECEMDPPLGKGPGYFCALQPCCSSLAPVLNAVPQAMLGNVSVLAATPTGRARRICRKDAAATHSTVCTATQADLNLDSPTGLTINMASPEKLAQSLDMSTLADQLNNLQTTYTKLVQVRSFVRRTAPGPLLCCPSSPLCGSAEKRSCVP